MVRARPFNVTRPHFSGSTRTDACLCLWTLSYMIHTRRYLLKFACCADRPLEQRLQAFARIDRRSKLASTPVHDFANTTLVRDALRQHCGMEGRRTAWSVPAYVPLIIHDGSIFNVETDDLDYRSSSLTVSNGRIQRSLLRPRPSGVASGKHFVFCGSSSTQACIYNVQAFRVGREGDSESLALLESGALGK